MSSDDRLKKAIRSGELAEVAKEAARIGQIFLFQNAIIPLSGVDFLFAWGSTVLERGYGFDRDLDFVKNISWPTTSNLQEYRLQFLTDTKEQLAKEIVNLLVKLASRQGEIDERGIPKYFDKPLFENRLDSL